MREREKGGKEGGQSKGGEERQKEEMETRDKSRQMGKEGKEG